MKIRLNIFAVLIFAGLFGVSATSVAAQDLIDAAAALIFDEKPVAAKTPVKKPAQPAAKTPAPSTAKKPAPAKAPNNSGNSLLDSLDSLLGDAPDLQVGDFAATTAKKTGAGGNSAAVDTTYKTANSMLLADKLTANEAAEEAKPVVEFINRAWSLYQQKTLQSGMKFNDLASAAAYAVSANYAVYNNTAPTSEAQQRGLHDQLKRIMQSSKDIGAFSDADKQLFAEMLVIKASVAVLFVQMSRQPNADPDLPNKAKDLAARNLAEIVGTNFADMSFTDNGLQK